MALLHYKGIGVPRNVTKAVEVFYKVLAKHSDAGYYLGEIFMGVDRRKRTPAGVSVPEDEVWPQVSLLVSPCFLLADSLTHNHAHRTCTSSL